MGTEKFIAFKEDGTAYRLKGRILRFLDNEPVSESDKTNIRSTLSVPASAEGLTPANNLSDLDSAATARTNLEVNSKDEDAQANALKVTAPALYFNGSSSVVTVADDDKLSFTDGTDDLPFSVSAWVKADDLSNFSIAGKYGTGNATREFFVGFNSSDKLEADIRDTSGNTAYLLADAAETREGQWIHVATTYAGAGPSAASGNAFSAAADGLSLLVNGKAVTATASNNASYAGMSNTSQPFWIGRQNNAYAKGHIRDCKIFNRELTASEVAQLARGNDLGFSEEWGGANGGVYTQDATPSGEWAAVNGTDADEAGPIGGVADVLKFTVDSSLANHSLALTTLATGKRFRVSGYAYIPSGQSNVDGFRIGTSASTTLFGNEVSPTQDAWVAFSGEGVANDTTLRIYAQDGGVTSFQDAGGDDFIYFHSITVTEIGTLADFRAEDYNESASKLLDRSSNNFVGVGTSVTLTGNQRHISADTIDLKNLPTSSAGLSAGEVWSNGGVLTVV